MSDKIHNSDPDSRAEPIFNGLAGESLQAFVDVREDAFSRFVAANPDWSPRFLSVQDLANRSSSGRF